MFNRRSLLLVGAAAAGATMCGCGAKAAAVMLPAPAKDETGSGVEKAVFAGGCFWGVQAVFARLKGVTSAVAGYCGGQAGTAHYEVVGSGTTGHAESVQVTFDPKEVSFGKLLQVFFSVATDPTQLNEQFPDQGTQYRNEIWCANTDQMAVAKAYIAQLDAAHVYKRPIVTLVSAGKPFYPAEDYHQDYLLNHPNQPYISMYDQPKVRDLKAAFPQMFRDKPLRVLPA
jgi:peptide-methionine (S)-S-oxide reductase